MSGAGETPAFDRDVVVVGGGPAGCAVAVCTGRYGLDTVVFDRGESALERCGHLENYLGFPAGVDVETFYGLMHDHVVESGCDVVPDRVETVESVDGGFRVRTLAGPSVTAPRVVAATTLGGDYLRGLDDGDAMFRRHEGETEAHERFDGTYADDDGRTPVGGLYVAGRMAGRGDLAIVAAGHGTVVGREVVADARRDDGYWEDAARHVDWVRRAERRADRWDDEGAWERWFEYHRLPDEHDFDDERVERVRSREVRFLKSAYLDDEERARRAEHGQRRLAAHLDDDVLLDAVDDERIREYAHEMNGETAE